MSLREWADSITSFLGILAWPIVVLILFLTYKESISEVIKRLSGIKAPWVSLSFLESRVADQALSAISSEGGPPLSVSEYFKTPQSSEFPLPNQWGEAPASIARGSIIGRLDRSFCRFLLKVANRAVPAKELLETLARELQPVSDVEGSPTVKEWTNFAYAGGYLQGVLHLVWPLFESVEGIANGSIKKVILKLSPEVLELIRQRTIESPPPS